MAVAAATGVMYLEASGIPVKPTREDAVALRELLRDPACTAKRILNRAPSASPPPASAPGRGKRPVGGRGWWGGVIGAFFCPTAVGTPLAEGKETRAIDGRDYVLEYPIKGDVALINAHRADGMGNLVYRKTARNFAPVMATAATTTVVQVDEVVPTGDLDPEAVVTPSVYVDRMVRVEARHYAVQ